MSFPLISYCHIYNPRSTRVRAIQCIEDEVIRNAHFLFTECPSHAAVQLGRSLFPLFALALDLPENFFDDKVTTETSSSSRWYSVPYSRPRPRNLLRSCDCFTILPKIHRRLPKMVASSELELIPSAFLYRYHFVIEPTARATL